MNKPVQYGSRGGVGSIGRVIAEHHWPNGSTVYDVKWQYGKDAYGNPVTATSRNKSALELTVISEEEYTAAVQREFNSGRRETTPYKRNRPAHQAAHTEHDEIMRQITGFSGAQD